MGKIINVTSEFIITEILTKLYVMESLIFENNNKIDCCIIIDVNSFLSNNIKIFIELRRHLNQLLLRYQSMCTT